MQIALLSVNLGAPRKIEAKSGTTGFYKSAQIGPVKIDAQGLVGDTIIDRQNHGGVDQAVYVYCQADYAWWTERHDLQTKPGLFGENLTISGMSSADAHVGGRLISDTMTLEITSPRTPCDTFAARMNDSSFPKRFWAARRPGFYCRVIQAGVITAGQHMQFVPFNGPHVTMKEWVDNEPLQKMDTATRQRFLSVPIHYKARAQLQS
jgi:MOSC domain-containing protein YiiM